MMNVAPATLNIAGKSVRGVVATCKCGVIKSMPFNSAHHSRPQSWIESTIARKLEADGWKTLKAKDGPVCPSCVSAAGVKGDVARGTAEPSMCAFAEQNRIIDELERRAEKIERTIIEIEKWLHA